MTNLPLESIDVLVEYGEFRSTVVIERVEKVGDLLDVQ